MEENKFYVYVYLDPRKPGEYIYGEYKFSYEPFYIGKGTGLRMYHHLYCKDRYNPYKSNKIKKILNLRLEPVVIKLEENLNNEEACNLEKIIIKTIGQFNLKTGPLTNITEGGDSPKMSEITKKKIKEKLEKYYLDHPEVKDKLKTDVKRLHNTIVWKKISIANKNKIFSEEHKRKISIANKGKIRTQDFKNHQSEIRKNIKRSKTVIEKIIETKRKNGTLNIPCSEEHKRKISIANKGKSKPCSEEHAKKISMAKKGKPNSKTRKIVLQFDLQNNFIKEWESISKAGEMLKIDIGTISNCCKGKQKKTKDFIFKYKNLNS